MSKSDRALIFQNWVFEEVLPSIRAKGGYISPTASAEQLEGLMAEIESLQKQLNYATRGRFSHFGDNITKLRNKALDNIVQKCI